MSITITSDEYGPEQLSDVICRQSRHRRFGWGRIGPRTLLHKALAACGVWTVQFVMAGTAGAALESGVYQTAPSATVQERGDRVPDENRTVPVSASFTFDLDAAQPSLTAVIGNAVLEGGEPFPLTVRSSSGAKLSDGSYKFTGDYLRDIHPSGTQYLFDWRFSMTADGRLVWNGITGWAGGHYWSITISDITITPDTIGPQLNITRDGTRFTLSWPATYPGYRLEQSASLLETGWNPVTDPVAVTGDRFSVSIDTIAERAFFRLRKV